MLLAFGARVNPLNNARKTPLDVYSNRPSSPEGAEDTAEIVALLRSYGAEYGADLSDTLHENAIKPFHGGKTRRKEKTSAGVNSVLTQTMTGPPRFLKHTTS